MKKILYLLCILIVFIAITAYADDVQVYNLDIKEMKRDHAGYVWVSMKIDVVNNNTSGSVSITIKGLDRDGFEVFQHLLRGDFKAYESRSLTSKYFLQPNEYLSIVSWTIDDVRKSLHR